MAHEKRTLDEIIDTLKQERDEVALRIHLASAEAKEEWEQLDEKWNELTDQYRPVKDALSETSENVIASMKLVGEELLEGFNRLRKSL